MAKDHNDSDAAPEAIRDPLQAAVRLLIALIVVAVIGLAVWALFFRDAEPVGGSAAINLEQPL